MHPAPPIYRYVTDAPRDTLLSANKEGVTSLPGYLAIALLGGALGDMLRPRASLRDWKVVSLHLPMISL